MVVAEFTEENYIANEGAGLVAVCLFLDIAIAKPLILYVEASETTPTSAIGKLSVCLSSFLKASKNVASPNYSQYMYSEAHSFFFSRSSCYRATRLVYSHQ